MIWLIVALAAYLILAVVFLADKYLLTEGIPNPKLFAFYSGLSGLLLFLLIPFIDFEILSLFYAFLAVLSGASFFMALFLLYKTLKTFEVSRVVPAIGALIPLFTLILILAFSKGKEFLELYELIALLFLITGGFFINYEFQKKIPTKSLIFSASASFFFSLYFVTAKYIYMDYSFISSLIWINMGGLLMSLAFFIFFKEIRKEIFLKKETFKRKTVVVFIGSKVLSGIGGVLQNFAIFLAPSLSAVAIINGLQGMQYGFILVIAVFLSLKYPKIIKEEISKKTIIQKAFSIFLIIIGLFIISIF